MARRTWQTAAMVAIGGWLALAGAQESATPPTVPNASFEEGGAQPAGWTLSGGSGSVVAGDGGGRAVAVEGDGQSSNYWRSPSLGLRPDGTYRVGFRARNLGASGGTAITGPVFANDDIGTLSADWRSYGSVFRAPRNLAPDEAWLRFGQWQVKGTLAFDQVTLWPVQPVYRRDAGGLALGEGESLHGQSYVFRAPYGGESGNESRPLASHTCYFNSNRWAFGSGSEVIYRHELAGRRQTSASVEVQVGWYAGGELLVQASADGTNWRDLGTIDRLASGSFDIPATLLPADRVWVRLSARAKAKVGANSDPGSLQVHAYTYRAETSGAACDLVGSTRFVAVTRRAPGFDLRLLSVGEGLPGGSNAVELDVAAAPAGATLGVQVEDATGRAVSQPPARPLLAGTRLTLPYDLPDAGEWRLRLSSAAGFAAETPLTVAELFRSGYGAALPGSTAQTGLWWCSSGWKVSRSRPAPTAQSPALVIRAARNEAEAAQLVVRPSQPLRALTVSPTALSGPGQAQLPSDRIDVLRVGYVDIAQPSDATGVAAPWPDPLPRQTGPIDLPAGQNQPFWLRVRVPRGQAPGLYRGTVRVSAQGFAADVPLEVQVFGFTLPDTMTCQTAFGFSPGNVFGYQKVSDPAQQRQVLDKYLRNYAEHHISPYNPAPLDGLKVRWPSGHLWQGGLRDESEKHGGAASWRVADTSTTGGVSAVWDTAIDIPAGGVRLSFWYKTDAPGHRSIATMGHRDANGQWMSGRNNDMTFTGDGTWQRFEREVKDFPVGAKSFTVTLWATLWSEDGKATGTVWYDDLKLTALADGRELLASDFESKANLADLRPEFDFAAWDQALAKAFDEYHFNSLMVPTQGMGGGTFHSRVEPELLGYREGTPEYQAAFTAYWRGIEEHLKAKGWLDKAYVYWFDEPDPKDYDFVMAGMKRLKQAAPGLRRMLTEQVEPALVGGPNLWCPISNEFSAEPSAPRMAAGEQFWWYVCTGPKAPYCGLFIDHPATEMRVWLWQTWQRKIGGILVWETNYWHSPTAYTTGRQNPYTDPMSWVSGYDTPAGTKIGWGNGDGRFVYPPVSALDGTGPVLDGPVDSLRWEMLRDGLEDYEYLALLQRALAKAPAAQRDALAKLLEVPADITTSATAFTRDPAPIEARRLEVARALERIAAP